MVDKNGASFLYRKRGVYYLGKQAPTTSQHTAFKVLVLVTTAIKILVQFIGEKY